MDEELQLEAYLAPRNQIRLYLKDLGVVRKKPTEEWPTVEQIVAMAPPDRERWRTLRRQHDIDDRLRRWLAGEPLGRVFRLDSRKVGSPGTGGRRRKAKRDQAIVAEVLRLVEEGWSRARAEREV